LHLLFAKGGARKLVGRCQPAGDETLMRCQPAGDKTLMRCQP